MSEELVEASPFRLLFCNGVLKGGALCIDSILLTLSLRHLADCVLLARDLRIFLLFWGV